MFNILKSLLILTLLVTLTGCETFTKTVYVVKYQTTVLEAPEAFTTKTPVPQPYDEAKYLKAGWPERAQLNAELVVKLYSAVGQCNDDKAANHSWFVTERKRYEKLDE